MVTRPAHQAGHLTRLLEAAGARVLHFPLLAIAEPADPARALAVIDRLRTFDLAIFISANAVIRGLAMIRSRGPMPEGLHLAAVGAASARELERAELRVDLVPGARFDSESLLALDELQAPRLAGHRVVIFRGEGGRELLADTLTARGATVEYAEVYRRAKPEVDLDDLLKPWERGELDAIVVTSAEALENLHGLLPPPARARLADTALVVVSQRLADLARSLGHSGALLVAERSADEAMVETLVGWRRHGARQTG